MRDVFTPGVTDAPNGRVLDVSDEPNQPASEHAVARQSRAIRRDKSIAEMGLFLLETAKMCEPVASLVTAKLLRVATLGSAVGLAAYAISHPSYERAVIAGGFMLLSPLLWWRA